MAVKRAALLALALCLPASEVALPAPAEAHRAHRRRAVPRRPQPPADSDLLDRLAWCESGMDRYVLGGRGRYHSYFQWLPSTWRSVSGLSGLPEDYDYETQKAAAARIPVSAWPRQFPGCSRKLGVR